MLLRIIGTVCKLLPFHAPSTKLVDDLCPNACLWVSVHRISLELLYTVGNTIVWLRQLPFVKMPICQNVVNEIYLLCSCYHSSAKYIKTVFIVPPCCLFTFTHLFDATKRKLTDLFWNLGALDRVWLQTSVCDSLHMCVCVRMIA